MDKYIDEFLSTPSARRATARQLFALHFIPNFYPRPPRGGRQAGGIGDGMVVIFLSTPSARRATEFVTQLKRDIRISIHALREEGDCVD